MKLHPAPAAHRWLSHIMRVLSLAGTLMLSVTQALAQTPPATFTQNYTSNAGNITVNYSRNPLRASNFDVYLHTGGDNYTLYTVNRPERTYIGRVVQYPGAVAVCQIKQDGTMRHAIHFENGKTWQGNTTTVSVPSDNAVPEFRYPPTVVRSGGAGNFVAVAKYALDLTYTYYNQAGLSVDETIERAEWSVANMNVSYLKDLGIMHKMARVVIRTNADDDRSTFLSSLIEQWRNVLPNFLPSTQFQICGSIVATGINGTASGETFSYSSIRGNTPDGNFFVTTRHEVSHNWGAADFGNGTVEGPVTLRWSAQESSPMVESKYRRLSTLENLGAFPYPLPPRSNTDRALAPIEGSLTLDVLGNDSDSNAHTISILNFDSTTHRGGSVVRSVGSGPNGRDQLVFNPASTTEVDWFKYRVRDSSGQENFAYVILNPAKQPPSATITADVTSVATGNWTSAATWSDNLAPAAGKVYEISNGHVVSGTASSFPGDALIVENGGSLDLINTASGGSTTQNISMNGLVLRDGSKLISHNTQAGNVTREFASPVVIAPGTATIRVQSDSSQAYTNTIRLASGIFGTGNVLVTGNLSGMSGERRFLDSTFNQVNFSGNWTVNADSNSDANRRLTLRSYRPGALGTGAVTLQRQAQLRNAAAEGLDSVSTITLSQATSTLDLDFPWNNPTARLNVTAGKVDLGEGSSVVGTMYIGSNKVANGTYTAAQLTALGYGGTFSGSGNISIVTIPSAASGNWDVGSTWVGGQSPVAGKSYLISSGHSVDSVSASVSNGGTVTFPGNALTIANGGTLRLRHTSNGGNTTHTVNLKKLELENGATLQSYNTSAGNVIRNLSTPLNLPGSGAVTLRIQSDGSSGYTNALRLNGNLVGTTDIQVRGTLAGVSGERRFVYVNASNPGYTGNWSIVGEGTSDNARRLFLVAEKPNALGSGEVQIGARAQLRNATNDGLNSVSRITLSSATSTLHLSSTWNNASATLILDAGTLNLGSGSSNIGSMRIGGDEVADGVYSASELTALGYGGSFTGSGSIAVGVPAGPVGLANPYNRWASQSLSAENQHQDSDRSPSADPDNDGLQNLLEYATGSNPESSNLQPVVLQVLQTSGGSKFVRYLRRTNDSAVDLVVEYQTTTLNSNGWQTLESEIVPAYDQPYDPPSDFEWVEQALPASTAPIFVRLKAASPSL